MLLEQLSEEIKDAMRAKDQVRLRSLRLIKSALMLLHSEGGSGPSADDEVVVLIKMAKQRKDSIAIFEKEGRTDLATKEQEELEVISQYLPKQLSEVEIKTEVEEIIRQSGSSSMKDMGKVMGALKSKHADTIDFSKVSSILKELLN